MADQETAPRKNEKAKKRRIWEIDFLRGFCILLMVMDHFFWDAKYLPQVFQNFDQVANPFINGLHEVAFTYWYLDARYAVHLIVAGLFFALSGISCSFSKNNFWHGAKILAAGLIIDLATYIVSWITGSIGVRMIFNVLTALGFGVLVVALLNLIPLPKTAQGLLYIGLGITIFILCMVFDLYWIKDNGTATSVFKIEHFFEYLVGLKQWGSDYFSVVPYMAYTLFGAGIGILFYGKKESLFPKLDGAWNRPFCFVGRNTLCG